MLPLATIVTSPPTTFHTAHICDDSMLWKGELVIMMSLVVKQSFHSYLKHNGNFRLQFLRGKVLKNFHTLLLIRKVEDLTTPDEKQLGSMYPGVV